MPIRSVLLAITLVMPLGLGAAADPNPPQPDPAADKAAAKIAQLDQRLENAKRL